MKVRKKKKMSRKAKIILAVSLVLLILLIVGDVLFFKSSMDKIRREYTQKNAALEERIMGATRTVYRAVSDIRKGQVLTEDLLEVSYDSLSDDPSETFITEEDLGKEATIDITHWAGCHYKYGHEQLVGELA